MTPLGSTGTRGVADGQDSPVRSPSSTDHHDQDHAGAMSGLESSVQIPHRPPPGHPAPPRPSRDLTAGHANRDEEGPSPREEPPVTTRLTRSNPATSRMTGSGGPTQNRDVLAAWSRVHFEDFALQLRLHRHHEHRKRMLSARRDRLRTAVALSARLHRVGSWVHDGLVEISHHQDATGFVRVHQRMHDLIDLCFSQWAHEINALGGAAHPPRPPPKPSFLTKLPQFAQQDCLELLQTLRSDPRFLIERFKAMSPAQISALSTFPRFQELSESVLTSLSQNRGRGSQRKRTQAYSKDLEEYAASFERSNPMIFLLHNIYGPLQDIRAAESQLRLATWSTICASLRVESERAFYAAIGPVLSSFATSHTWQVRKRLELFLMSILQRGAFLLDLVEHATTPVQSEFGLLDPFGTPQAQDFFDGAVKELFQILACEGGFPDGALRLARAIIGKLPSVELQSEFRGHFYFQWFLREFLRITVTYPEFHISDKARSHLLQRLWDKAFAQASDVFNTMPSAPVDTVVQDCVISMIDQLDADECANPYYTRPPGPASSLLCPPPSLSICAADLAHTLEALKPQFIHTSSPWDSFLSSSHSTFSMQYHHASGKFDKLRQRILDVIEPGRSSKSIHPCQEDWTLFQVSVDGNLSILSADRGVAAETPEQLHGNLNTVERAVFRLAEGDHPGEGHLYLGSLPNVSSTASRLSQMFAEAARHAQIETDSVAAAYWDNALAHLRMHYPWSLLADDDSKVLMPMIQNLESRGQEIADTCLRVEQQVAELEALYSSAKAKILNLSTGLDRLRVKLWYKTEVLSSQVYEDAKNISTALKNMAISALKDVVFPLEPSDSSQADRVSISGTSTSSMFDQQRIDTMTMLKAPAEHGGPKKLSDHQIELTRKWLERSHVDNFCKGEERIHRFCMEVKLATRKLVGETLGESPVLWSSELFAREKNLYDIQPGAAFSAQPSTRTPSVMSEPLSSSYVPGRTTYPAPRGSFYSQGSARGARDFLGSDLASLISSSGRATTVTTLESIGSVWSTPQSNPRSVTSASLHSRPGSTFDDVGLSRLGDHSQEKADFLDGLQKELTCLLLSDLGCPVWSCGSETDAWMDAIWRSASVVDRLHRRAVVAQLIPSSRTASTHVPHATRELRHNIRRRHSLTSEGHRHHSDDTLFTRRGPEPPLTPPSRGVWGDEFSFMNSFNDILRRMSEQVDPNLKLKAVHDFKAMAELFQQHQRQPLDRGRGQDTAEPGRSAESARRHSLNPSLLSASLARRGAESAGVAREKHVKGDESNAVRLLKDLLFVLRPKTLFRDLQYMSAFVSSHTLDDTAMGRTFLQVGLAALAWKDEVCRGMVEVADEMVARGFTDPPTAGAAAKEPSVHKAAEYWMIAAREGNAIAQRELAILYLTHPRMPAPVSLPLTLSSDIFRRDMMWDGPSGTQHLSHALCLALHWMQQAAENGDEVAQTKLKERQVSRTIS